MKDYLAERVRAAPDPVQGRNLAREYLQARILGAWQRSGAMLSLAFHGGTALRLPVRVRTFLRKPGLCPGTRARTLRLPPLPASRALRTGPHSFTSACKPWIGKKPWAMCSHSWKPGSMPNYCPKKTWNAC